MQASWTSRQVSVPAAACRAAGLRRAAPSLEGSCRLLGTSSRRCLARPPTSTSTATPQGGNGLVLQDVPTSSPEPDLQAEGGRVNWRKQWWAVSCVEDVDPSRPLSVKMLNTPLVIWRGPTGGDWRCFEDRCPHRGAPLSEGKVWPDGTLLCAYHGWRFKETGECTAIPQAASAAAEAAACASAKSCVRAHPIKEAQGVLFVWGEGGAAAAEEAERQPLPIDDFRQAVEAAGEAPSYFIKPFQRDFPNDFITLVEQALDPAHVDWAHHLVQGDRRKTAYGQWETWAGGQEGPEPPGGATNGNGNDKVGTETSSSTQRIGAMGWNDYASGAPSQLELLSPVHLRYSQRKPDGTLVSVMVYSTPLSPGRMRGIVIGIAAGPAQKAGMRFLGALPKWMQHALVMNPTSDGDVVLLHPAEHLLCEQAWQRGGEPNWRKDYFLPTASDRMVSAFRRWLEGPGGDGPWGAPLAALADYPPEITDRRALLDRYTQHTQHCAACKRADTWMARLATAAAAAAGAAWTAAAYLAATAGAQAASAAAATLRGRYVLALVAAGAALWLVRGALGTLRTAAFHHSDYVHSKRLH